MRILVVEDHPATVELLEEVLRGDGHVVTSEHDGLRGRRQALTDSFDLILCDIGLPGLDGLSLAKQLRAAGSDISLVALSGRATDEDRTAGLAAGFDGYLTKPITSAALLREMAVREAGRPPVREPVVAAIGAAELVAPLPPSPTIAPAPAPTPDPPVATRRRGVLGGLVVIAMGLPFVLQPLGVPNAASYLFLAMGAAFGTSYLRSRQYVYLIPTATLVSFGIALLLPTWITMRPDTIGPAFVGVVALGFVAAFALAPSRRWPLVPAVVLGVVSAGRMLSGASLIPAPLEPFVVPVVLVAVGTYLLIERQD